MSGLTRQDECYKCPAGTFSTADVITFAENCTKCMPGYYSSEQGAQSSLTCQVRVVFLGVVPPA